MVAAGIAEDVVVQASYAIGIAQPMSVFVNTNGTAKVKNADGTIMQDGEIASIIQKIFDLRPYHIVKRYGLKNPIFLPTASYGHFGRDHYVKEVEVYYKDEETIERIENGQTKYFKNVVFPVPAFPVRNTLFAVCSIKSKAILNSLFSISNN